MAKKNLYVIDTSALLFDPAVLTYFKGNQILIPVSVIQELDKHKDRHDEVGTNARAVHRQLHNFKKLGKLSKGVTCPNSQVTIQLSQEYVEDLPESLDRLQPDNRILSVCLHLNKATKNKNLVHLVTNDLNLSLKAEAFGISSIEFQPEDKYVKTNYKGFRNIDETNELLIDNIYLAKDGLDCPKSLNALENEFFLIRNPMTKKSVRVMHREGKLYKLSQEKSVYGIQPLNNEQRYALELLMDPKIQLVTLTGLAGSGKTLLSVAAGLCQTIEPDHREYDRMLISRSLVVLAGKDKLGFLKGSLKEKLDPYLLPLKDAVDQVMGNSDSFEYLTATTFEGEGGSEVKRPRIEIEPLQYIRGRSIRNVYFLIDEAQNLTLAEVKTIISRAGDGAKLVLMGDIHQIDNPYLSKTTNGLSQVIERFKNSKIAGHVSFVDGVRSELATEAAERL